MLALTLGCAAAVAGRHRRGGSRAAGRTTRGCARPLRSRPSRLAPSSRAWLSQGPLARGWARRSGTPAALLGPRASAHVARTDANAGPAAGSALLRPFSADLRGPLREGLSAGGMAVVDLDLRLTGDVPGGLRLRIAGDPAADGGVLMRRSAVTLGPPGSPGQLQGRIVSLRGSTLEALVRHRGRPRRAPAHGPSAGGHRGVRHGDGQPASRRRRDERGFRRLLAGRRRTPRRCPATGERP